MSDTEGLIKEIGEAFKPRESKENFFAMVSVFYALELLKDHGFGNLTVDVLLDAVEKSYKEKNEKKETFY